MINALSELIGCTVTKVERVHDYLQIIFSNGSIMNVYNKYSYDGNVSDLVSKTLVSFSEHSDSVELRFVGSRFEIGLRDADYSGPEAIALRRPGKEPVIWN